MKLWMIASSIAAGVVVISVIVIFYSIPVNPCSLVPFQNADAILAPTTTKELYDNAEVVVLGKITGSSAKCEGIQIWTHMQVQVEEYLKNPQEAKILTAKSIGGAIGNYGYWMEDSPIYNRGDRVLLFLFKDNPEDEIYRISFPTGIIQDQDVTGRDLLKSISLQSVTNGTIPLARGTETTAVLSLESFFGYDSPTNVTATSFTFYNISTPNYSNNDSITALSDFGLTVGPAYTLITPSANGTETIEFKLSATNEAIESVYDIYFLATGEDRFYYVNPSAEYAFVRVNVTDSGVHSNGDIASKILTSEGITLGTPYLVQISWNLSETFHGNGTDLSVLIKDKETMDPLKEVTYDFMYKGNFELGGFQDKYIADFSTPDRFRTGIQNPCDMHITIFIDKVDQLSFSKTDPDEIMRYGNTPSVVIQFKTFTEEGSVGDCNAGDDIKLVLFNGYNLDGDRIRPEAAIPIVTTLNSYDLPTEATLTNYTVKQVAEQHRKLCGESAFNSEIASMSEDDPTFQRWLPQRLHFVHIQPKEPIFRQGCFHTPSGIYYEHFIIQNNTAVPLDLSSNIIEIETPQQAVEHIAYFEYGGKNGGVSILSDEKEYNEAVRVCGEANSSPVRNIRVIQFGDGTFSVELNRTNWNTGELEYQYWQSETNSTLPKLISTIGIGHCGSVI